MPSSRVVFDSPDAVAVLDGHTGHLRYLCRRAAGAIGHRQGESLLAALEALGAAGCTHLHLTIDSAGAHFAEPLQGLRYIDRIIHRLWQFKTEGAAITVACEGWLYGGMALAVAACADQVYLGPQARMGLFGNRVLKESILVPAPPASFKPPGMQLHRLSARP